MTRLGMSVPRAATAISLRQDAGAVYDIALLMAVMTLLHFA